MFLKSAVKACVFVIENALIDSRPHYHLDASSTVHTKTFENDSDRITRCDVSETLCACYKHTRLFGRRFHFDAFSTFQTNTKCMRFRFDPLSREFSMKTLSVLV